MKAAGYMNLNITMQSRKTEDIIEHMQKLPKKLEQRSLLRVRDERLKLDHLLDSNDPLFFKDRLLTAEGKSKLKSLIEIVLKD
ncbi:hypothetical protein ACMX2I_04940 [Bacillus sp. SW14]|uniref:hypothetical protein n=1 Tax=Bacillus sp. SW14 TaxID=3391618 RepID=UPI0039E4024A